MHGLRHDAGALVSITAIILALSAQAVGGSWPVWLGLALFGAGLAHGAGDEQDGRLHRISLVHAIAYLVIGIAVAGLFIVLPLGGLAIFLSLSAWHFTRSDCGLAPGTRLAIAGLGVGGSALFQPSLTSSVLGAITGGALPQFFLSVLKAAGISGAAFAIYALAMGKCGGGKAVISLLAVALFHPVLAVGLVFLTAHAVPIQQRQLAAYGAQRVWHAIALPTAIAGLGGMGISAAVASGLLDVTMGVALALGLATPHMLTERLES